MHPTNPQVIASVHDWLAEERTVWLATVIAAVDASPRPAGSLLALDDQGRWAGAIAGSLEQELIRRSIDDAGSEEGWPRLVDHGIGHDERRRFRLPGNGRVSLLVERLAGNFARDHVAALHQQLQQRQRLVRQVTLADGTAQLLPIRPMAEVELDGDVLRHKLGPDCRLLLVGAGEVSRYVARLALANGFEVSLCEPRDLFLTGWDEPGVEIMRRRPDDLVVERFSDLSCAVVALAQDPGVDDSVLLAALDSNAFYVGALGGRRDAAQRRQRLHERGVTGQQMSRLHGPAGFDIGSRTPPEIAVSILAQLLAERHRLLRRPVSL